MESRHLLSGYEASTMLRLFEGPQEDCMALGSQRCLRIDKLKQAADSFAACGSQLSYWRIARPAKDS
jgi:hypothetical protein